MKLSCRSYVHIVFAAILAVNGVIWAWLQTIFDPKWTSFFSAAYTGSLLFLIVSWAVVAAHVEDDDYEEEGDNEDE